jgi:hypothetical protein
MGNGSTTKAVRLVHRYIGLYFAPAILFFAFSGAMQTFGWHETSRGSYRPPEWLVKMAQLHKKQTLDIPPAKIRENKQSNAQLKPTSADALPAVPKQNSDEDKTKFALKCFVFVMSFALMLPTILGMVMAFRYGGNPRVVWAVLLVGALFPVAIVQL